ncbi:MAG: hypothetical protein IJK84_00460 [Bacteroidales bacterium]|nr:hypothetical protein [Bacteroidales bacterium]
MNKILAQKVKDKCKDMGLSEEYVNGITEVLGADIADDSTDSEAIETVANRIADIAKRSQGEATRWAQKKTPQPAPTPTPKPQPTPTPQPPDEEPAWAKAMRENMEKRIKGLEDQNKELLAERKKNAREAVIGAALDKHKIPAYLRKYIGIPEDVEDAKIEEYVAGMAQEFVTNQLPDIGDQGRQVASKQETEAAADAFFKSHVKLPKQD